MWIWDFAFFLSFAIVVTSSVTTAGVLLVFSLLIVPAVIGSIFSEPAAGRAADRLERGHCGLRRGSRRIVCARSADRRRHGDGLARVPAAGRRSRRLCCSSRSEQRRRNLRIASDALAHDRSGRAARVERLADDRPDRRSTASGAGRDAPRGSARRGFSAPAERDTYESAARDAVRFQGEVERLNAMEKAARYQGTPLSDDEIRRIASYQQSFNEMTRGERFVQEVLRGKARARERWIVGLPAAMVALLGFALLARPWWRGRHGGPGDRPT